MTQFDEIDDDLSWGEVNRFLYDEADEPAYRHCAHVFDPESAHARGGYGKWCHVSPGPHSDFCHFHAPGAKELRERKRSSRRRLESDHRRRLKSMGIDW